MFWVETVPLFWTCSSHWASVEGRHSVASCVYLTHVACKYLNTHYNVHQVLFIYFAKLMFTLQIYPLNYSLYDFCSLYCFISALQ